MQDQLDVSTENLNALLFPKNKREKSSEKNKIMVDKEYIEATNRELDPMVWVFS